MIQEIFDNQKQYIQERILEKLNSFRGNDFELYSLKRIKKVIESYTYENRLERKGLVTRIIIDNLELDNNLGEQIMKFDEFIR